MPLKSAIAEVINGRSLTIDQARDAMTTLMSGNATQAQIGSYLTALRMKGETVAEVAGSADAMRSLVVRVKPKTSDILMDIVGTGGDGKNTFNVSTTTAFVVAGSGIHVAKHGNRGASSKSGSADVLMSLGANLDISGEQVADCVDEIGIGFMYAVKHHPAMKHAIGPRRELGQRTIFNILGPLTNPAHASHFMIGVYDPALTEVMANVLNELGAEEGMVVHGAGGLDELSCIGTNKVSRLHKGVVTTYELDPLDIGLARTTIDAYAGGEPEENAVITRNILNGSDHSPRRDIVLFNAAAAISLVTGDLQSGLEKAQQSIDSGAALSTLTEWIAKTQSFA